MSHHVQLESTLSLTGANADKRLPLTSAEIKKALAALFAVLHGSTITDSDTAIAGHVNAMAQQLKAHGTNAVVVCGLEDTNAQLLTLAINEMLQSAAFDTQAPRYIRSAQAKAMDALIEEMSSGRIGALFIDKVNPVYSLPNGTAFAQAMQQVGFTVTSAYSMNETAEQSSFVAANSHYLESWADALPKKGYYTISQPVIRNLFDTRQFEECLMKWAGVDGSYHDFIQENWRATVLQGASWNKAVQDGVFHSEVASSERVASLSDDQLAQAQRELAASSKGLELVLYAKTGMGDGQMANNPWLQEFPDPISRASWDNYLTISKADAESYGLKNVNVANGGLDGSYVKLTVNGTSISNVPVMIQPGQAKGTVGLALGYGRKVGLQSEMQTGVNAYAVYFNASKVQEVTIEKQSGMHEFACVQLHKTLMGRGDIIKETTLEDFINKPASEWNEVPVVSLDHQEVPANTVDLWESFDRSVGHHFNLSIDLNACTGCGACVIACHAENNVPVVGKKEIRVSRDMHWLRIDRYYSSEESFAADDEKKDNFDGLFGDNGSLGGFGTLEDPSANPQVAFQPVMCQHCNHAPCETVCPVAATSHSRQGHNHMAYNRCIGTRYCANNCPYKVRRFNWFRYNQNDEFDFHMNNDLGRMVLNPDVNVRSRGVMEKCSFCIQRTQKAILDAKAEGRAVKDAEFQTACSAACDTGALVFGDVNDKESEVANLKESERMYHLLEHVGTQPNVFYQVKVRNTHKA
jgi:molybdopterin-containing oxidoreductase family iron-sulfur binding subunit